MQENSEIPICNFLWMAVLIIVLGILLEYFLFDFIRYISICNLNVFGNRYDCRISIHRAIILGYTTALLFGYKIYFNRIGKLTKVLVGAFCLYWFYYLLGMMFSFVL